MEPVKSGCWCADLSPWIHTVHWCKVRSSKCCKDFSMCSPRSCIVPPEVPGASRSEKEVLFQGNVTQTYDTKHIIIAFASLTREFTRTCLFDVSFFQIDIVCHPRPCGAPPLAHSASRSNVAVVYGKSVTYTCDLAYTINPRDVSSTTSSLNPWRMVSSQYA